MRNRFVTGLMATVLGAGLFATAGSAVEASSKGRKNTTIALGAVALHQLLKGKTTNALIAGAGTAYAYKRYKDARDEEKRRERYYYGRRR